MRSLVKIFILGSFIMIFMASCSGGKDPVEKFSKLSVEDNKAIIEETGMDFVGVLDRMRATHTVEALGNFIEISQSSESEGIVAFTGTGLFAVLETYNGFAAGAFQMNDIFKSVIDCKSEDPESIQEFWDENVGTYTWNKSTLDWDNTPGGNSIILKFPSSDNSSVNDATFTIYNYQGVFIENPAEDEYSGDLPTGIKADLKIGTETILFFVFSASYDSDGLPNAIASDLEIEEFRFEVDVTNNSEKISATSKMLENDDLIMKLTGAVNGLFTDENIEDNTIHHSETYTYICDYVYNPTTQTWEEVYCTDTDEWDEVEFEEILNSADAEFQVMNIALRGDVDIKGLYDQIRIIEEDYDDDQISSEEYDQLSAEAINKYLNLRLINLDKNQIMAKAEAYVVHETDEWDDYTYVGFRLIFGDGSPIDMETYFEEGFDDFIDSLNDLLQDLSSDYDLDIEPIDY